MQQRNTGFSLFFSPITGFLVCAIFSAALLCAQSTTWLSLVSPILTNSEKKGYLALSAKDRAAFEEDFWKTKAITADEYFRRIQFCRSGLRLD